MDALCVAACTADTDCAEGFYCDASTCRVDDRPKPFCESNDDCNPGHPCEGGVCRTPCGEHADCLRFDVQFNYCLEGLCATTNEVTSDCRTTEDCDGQQACTDGICR